MGVHPIPDGYHSVTPYLTVGNARRLLEFVQSAFGAEKIHCTTRPDGGIAHAAVKIGTSMVELADAHGPWQPMPSAIHLYVADADASYARALDAGATSLHAPMDTFYGERCGGVVDPSGNHWYIATHVEDVAPAELERRAAAFMAKPR